MITWGDQETIKIFSETAVLKFKGCKKIILYQLLQLSQQYDFVKLYSDNDNQFLCLDLKPGLGMSYFEKLLGDKLSKDVFCESIAGRFT